MIGWPVEKFRQAFTTNRHIMFPELNLSQLPSVPLSEINSLPTCPAIYFALDPKNRVLYVGKTANLLARWKDHHRLEQLKKLNRKNPVNIAWLACENGEELLTKYETYFISIFHPSLNKAPIPAKKIIPSELVLQQTLAKISKYVVIVGFDPGRESEIPTVYLKYSSLYRSPIGTIRSIFKADNKKPKGLRWSEYRRRQYSFWKATCNGVAIDVAPWHDIRDLREKAIAQKLAGVEMLAIGNPEFTELVTQNPFLKEKAQGLCIFDRDPLPLLWSTH